jgi:hypothetical protein
MPAIPVLQPKSVMEERANHGVMEDGDHIYIAAPVQLWTPNDEQIEELAFAKQVKAQSPNENIVWFKGSYVEADNPNGNGAMWQAGELGVKSVTPRLMPVTVMHDPRTAVGVIADTTLLTPEKDKVPRARIDTILALWGHRFPEAVAEAVANARQGTLMQSMECFSPWYECSECGSTFTKLPGGAEQASWCDHLKASNPHAGFVDLTKASHQRSNASRILGDVTFTGTGLIYGTRGAKGAYSDAFLEMAELLGEVASFHRAAHTNTATNARSESHMGLVQIEQSELDTLRKERDDARTEVTAAKQAQQEAERKVEAVEAEKTAAEEKAQQAETKVTELEETARKATLTDERMSALGEGFTAKLGDTTKANLKRDAATLDEAAWDTRLKEVEELVAVKRDAAKDGSEAPANDGESTAQTFKPEELAKLGTGLNGGGGSGGSEPTKVGRQSVAKGLAKALAKS